MWRDDAYLLDMLISSKKIVNFTSGISKKEFLSDEILQHAVMRLIQIIGESARGISSECKDRYTEIPWKAIIGMRNKLIHEYFRIDEERVWEVIIKDIPELIQLIEPIVPQEE